MESLFTSLVQYGALGIMCAVLLYDVFYLQKKILSIVENNTQTMAQVKEVITKCNK